MEIVKWIIVGFLGTTTFLETFTSKMKPWTWLLRRIGEIINEPLNNKIDEISVRLEEHIEYDAAENARLGRARIITFAGEARRGIPHTKEQYDSILEDIGRYRKFCDDHKDFPNNVANQSMSYIESKYAEHMNENTFLE